MKRTIILTLIVFVNIYLFALTDPPKREFRGAWIATVANLDWPSSPTASVSTQKVELIEMLDVLGDCGINAVIFQVRTECDALYQSNYEPWSYWLTGSQGSSPGLFDPLEFIIDEAHQRGMELHAWFNPYRAVNRIGDYSIHSSHVSKLHPEWILTFSPINKKYLDPGLPMVEDYIVTVIMDVVNRYDVDGVHFDDYFYPYPNSGVSFSGITTEDDATFQLYNCGFTDRKAWRRDNINKMIEAVYDSIQAVKPYVKFGVSPFGIWKNGVPSGITGLDAYNYIYCDAPEWLNQHTVDYIVPQLYWKIGGNQDYKKLLPWWSTKRNDRHLYPGQIFSSSYSTDELINQVLFNRQTEGVGGNVLFRSRHILYNTLGFNNYMQSDFHRYPALWPVMSWKDTIQPNIPLQIRYETLSGNVAGLLWDIPEIASDGDSAYRYVLYRSTNQSMDQQFIDNPANIVTICGNREIIPEEPEGSGPYYYAVSALDRNSNES
ncbi:MAG: family 10 glycosylhydrolase, partial [Candidatus Marinimicrobia bacterium]|nr:family 10 glycosylhydrolase [Candidatus Neomarinimicrobiota bacterium]